MNGSESHFYQYLVPNGTETIPKVKFYKAVEGKGIKPLYPKALQSGRQRFQVSVLVAKSSWFRVETKKVAIVTVAHGSIIGSSFLETA